MADRHPYFQTPGQFVQLVNHLKRAFPSSVTADTIKKLGLAPKNESYLVNALRSLGLIDEEGKKTDLAGRIFSLQDDAFQKELSATIKKTYSQLFELHSESAWALDTNKLIAFFRQTDQSSAAVGKFQATAFKTLAGLAGHGETPEPRQKKSDSAVVATAAKKAKVRGAKHTNPPIAPIQGVPAAGLTQRNVGLTVRVEINLPAEGDQQTYDRIFKSIRENLLNG